MERVGHPSEVVSVGETLTLRVISLDMERHRIGLSLEKVDSADYAAIDFEQMQEELTGESELEESPAETEEVEEEPVAEVSEEETAEESEEETEAEEEESAEESEEEVEETDEPGKDEAEEADEEPEEEESPPEEEE